MKQLPILAYHGLTTRDSAEEKNKYNICVEDFSQQMQLLYERGYTTPDSIDFFFEPLSNNVVSGKQIVITLDDGHKSNFEYVLPILEKYRFKAIFFITTGLIEKENNFMDWPQVKELCKNGHFVQSHCHSHRFLNHLNNEEITFELEQSRNLIRKHTYDTPVLFSCPGGRYNSRLVEISKNLGYRKMFTSDPGNLASTQLHSRFSLGRWVVTRDTKINDFKRIVEADTAAVLAYKSKFYFKKFIKKIIGDRLYHNFSRNSQNG